jgi:hypothetical protein
MLMLQGSNRDGRIQKNFPDVERTILNNVSQHKFKLRNTIPQPALKCLQNALTFTELVH